MTAGPAQGEAERETQAARVLGLALVFSASVQVSLSTQFIFGARRRGEMT